MSSFNCISSPLWSYVEKYFGVNNICCVLCVGLFQCSCFVGRILDTLNLTP